MWLLGNGLYMGGKAKLAQNLLDRAWTKTSMTGDVYLPWSWMDAHPVARLKIEGDERSHIVLNTDSGQALAFGPAVISGTENTDLLGIAAHKNTQFQNLRTKIIDSRKDGLPIEVKAKTPSRLALVTCYPFDAVSFNGPMRYVVYAERV